MDVSQGGGLTWPYAVQYLAHLAFSVVCLGGLCFSTLAIRWVGKKLSGSGGPPGIVTLFRWLEYYVWWLAALIFAALISRISFDFVKAIWYK